MIVNYNNETNFPHVLLLTKRRVANFCEGFENNLSTNAKLSKTPLSKLIQSGGFLGRLLETGLPLMKSVLKPWAESVLIP